MKKYFTLLVLLSFITSCGSDSSTTDTSDSSNSSGNTQTQQTSGPQATPTPVNYTPPAGTGVTYYPTPTPTTPATTPGTPITTCGVAYRKLNDSAIYYRSNDLAQDEVVSGYSQNAKNHLSKVRFTAAKNQDALYLCFEGYQTPDEILVDNVTSTTTATNPHQPITGHQYRVCGHTAVQDSHDGSTYLVIQSEQYNYIVFGTFNNGAIPHVGSVYVNEQTGVEACYYSNKAPYTDYAKYHKKLFDAQAIDLGSL